jgi:uncharacterized BrkB/YihY/UPF0761 family membrane protein
MTKSVRSNFSDDSLSDIFDIEKITKSVKNSNILRYLLIFLLMFTLLGGLFTLYFNFTGQEDELE